MQHKITLLEKEYEVVFDKKFERLYKRLTKKDNQTRKLIDDTIELFLKNPEHEDLNLHQIYCKVDITRLSVYIRDEKKQDTGLRIMLHTIINEAVIFYVGTHDAYMRENKDC